MPPTEERRSNGTHQNRRPWLYRYGVIVSWALAVFTLVAIGSLGTWKTSSDAHTMAIANAAELDKQEIIVDQVPVIQSTLKNHIAEFRDFRGQQREAISSISNKLDIILRNQTL